MTTLKEMIGKFQCPGCMHEESTDCERYKPEEGRSCEGHVLGTFLGLGNPIALGLPTGFNKPGFAHDDKPVIKIRVRLFPDKDDFDIEWNHLNVPVWAMEVDGYLFVRTFCPRINVGWIDVIAGGTMAMVPDAIDVSKFINEID